MLPTPWMALRWWGAAAALVRRMMEEGIAKVRADTWRRRRRMSEGMWREGGRRAR
jgi:hypothetical protein